MAFFYPVIKSTGLHPDIKIGSMPLKVSVMAVEWKAAIITDDYYCYLSKCQSGKVGSKVFLGAELWSCATHTLLEALSVKMSAEQKVSEGQLMLGL